MGQRRVDPGGTTAWRACLGVVVVLAPRATHQITTPAGTSGAVRGAVSGAILLHSGHGANGITFA